MKKKKNKNEIRARDVDPRRPIYSISIVNTAHLVRDGRLPPPPSKERESNYSNRRNDRRQQTAFSFSRTKIARSIIRDKQLTAQLPADVRVSRAVAIYRA